MNVIEPNPNSANAHQPLRQGHWLLWFSCYVALLLALVPVPAAAAPLARVYAEVAPGCLNLIGGGDFEQFNPSWQLQASTRPPMYTNEQTFNNSLQAMRLGNGFELPNLASVSEVRHQPILLPYGATRIILRFLYYPVFDAAPGTDLQQADLFDATTDQLIGTLLNAQDGTGGWKARDYDLTLYAGRTISLRFRVRNDGVGGRTLMYIDNVELEYCAQTPLPTYTPTLSPTPTGPLLPTNTPTLIPSATPIPVTPIVPTAVPTYIPPPPEDPSCPNIVVNGTFEGNDGWHFGEDPVPARYVNTFVQEGARAVLLGNPPENPTNVTTFSSIRQLVTIPFTTGAVQLRWWRLLHSAQTGIPTGTTDRQDVILLSPNLQPIQILRRELRNDGVWQEDAVDLSLYRGQTLYLYFNAFNDTNNARTWMYLDNVRLRVCGAPIVAPTAALPPATATPLLATAVAIPVTPNLTYTIIPTLTLSPVQTNVVSPLLAATITPTLALLPSPDISATVAAALAPAPLRAAAALPPVVTPTNNVYPLPTLPTQTVVEEPTTAVPDQALAAPTPSLPTPTPIVSVSPVWADRLGTFAILLGIPIVILLVILAIPRLRRNQP
ncbi:MAG: hypothetical protein KF832_09110 [Caldilineaceae bacterium]|nr:hypothetical protein [Caldilineaceae bacterium]